MKYTFPKVLQQNRLFVRSVLLNRLTKEYGGMQIDQAKRLKTLEKENARLKRLVADKELDIKILKETVAFESKNS